MLVHINSDTHRRAVNTTAVLLYCTRNSDLGLVNRSSPEGSINLYTHALKPARIDTHDNLHFSAYQYVYFVLAAFNPVYTKHDMIRYDTATRIYTSTRRTRIDP